jgi:3-oxoacyl-[acyl-carrier-protein] synthase II
MTTLSSTVDSRPTASSGELVLSAWSAVSAYGIGRDEFSAGILARRCAVTMFDREAYPGPFDRGGLVPDFDTAARLGRKGTRTMNRVTAITVTTINCLLEECGPDLTSEPERIGLVLGTGAGSVQSIMDFTRESLTGEKPYHVDASRFPNTFMNRAAGLSAMWHRLKGPNTTIAGGRLTGLLTLSYGSRLLRGGHCPRVLCGATEEYSEQRAWLEWSGWDQDRARPPLGEGGAIFVLESAGAAGQAGRRPLAKVLATRFRAFGELSAARQALADCVREAIERAGRLAGDVRLVAPLGDDGELGEVESAAIADALGAATPQWVRCQPLLGDTAAASTSFQIAAALAAGETWSGSTDLALVTGIDRDGTVGCALLGTAAAAPA